jgi:hypothetical protein
MELNEFIKGVIVDIRKGIKDASEELKGNILPHDFTDANGVLMSKKRKSTGSGTNSENVILSNIEFEVVLMENNKEGGSVGLGVFLGEVGLGTKKSSEDVKSSLSKIKFTIPIVLE